MKAIIEKTESVDSAKGGVITKTITYKFLSIPVFRTTKCSSSEVLLRLPEDGEVVSFTESSK